MLRLSVSFQMTWFRIASFDSEMGSDRRLVLWNSEIELKALWKKTYMHFAIPGNNIGSKGHWREPDSILGTKLYIWLSRSLFLSRISSLRCPVICRPDVCPPMKIGMWGHLPPSPPPHPPKELHGWTFAPSFIILTKTSLKSIYFG